MGEWAGVGGLDSERKRASEQEENEQEAHILRVVKGRGLVGTWGENGKPEGLHGTCFVMSLSHHGRSRGLAIRHTSGRW